MASGGIKIDLKNAGMDQDTVQAVSDAMDQKFWSNVEKHRSQASGRASGGAPNDNGGSNTGGDINQRINITENNGGTSQLTEAAMALRTAAENMQNSMGRLSDALGGFAESSRLLTDLKTTVASALAAAKNNQSEAEGYRSSWRQMNLQDDIDRMYGLTMGNQGGILGWAARRLAADRQAAKGAGIDLNDKDYKQFGLQSLISDIAAARDGHMSNGTNVADALYQLISKSDSYHNKTERDIANRKGMGYQEARDIWKNQQAENALKAQQRAAEEAAAAAQAEKARAEEGVKLDRTQKQNERLDSVKRDTDRSNPTKQQSGDVDINTKGDVHIDSRNTSGVNGNGPGGAGGGEPPNPKDRPMYLNKLSELTDLLKEEGLDNIADEVKRQLAVLKSNEKDLYGSTASNIAATFGSDGSFQGFTLKAKSITLGDVDTATMSYKVGDEMVTTTRANQDKLAKFTERLTQDTASAEQQFNMWMNHSALQSRDASGRNNRIDQLMGYLTGSNGQQLGYVDKKGQVQIGRLNAEGLKETLTRTELDELQNNLGVFRNEMSVLNRSMRQDFAQNGIDVIGQKHDKLLAERDLLKTRLTSMGLKQNDTLRNGDSLASLFGRINAAEGRYRGAAGNVDAQVKAYNDLHDAIKQADAAVQGEMRTRSASMALTREDIRTQNVLSKAQTAMSAKNADAQTSIMKTLQKSINQLESAGTPEEKLRALNSITQQTSKLTKATSEYNAQAKHMSKLDSQISQMRTQLKEAGDLQAPESMRLAAKAMNDFKQSKDPSKRTAHAEEVEQYIQQAREDVNRAVKVENTAAVKFDRDSKKAENQYNRITKNDLLAAEDREAIEKAYKAFNEHRDTPELEGLQQALSKATGNIAQTKTGDKTAEIQARINAKQLALNTAQKRAGGQDNWSDENKALFKKAQDELTEASAQLQSGSITRARSFLGRATTDLGSLNTELGKSEKAIKAATEAQEQKRKEDETIDKATETLTSPGLAAGSKEARDLESALNQVNQIRNTGTGDMAQAMTNLTNAMAPADAALKKFEQDAKQAEQRYQKLTGSDAFAGLSAADQQNVRDALGAFQGNKTAANLQALKDVMTFADGLIDAQVTGDKKDNYTEKLGRAQDKLTRSEQRNGGITNWTDEQLDMYDRAEQFLNQASKAAADGNFEGAGRSLANFGVAMSRMNESFSESEKAAAAVEAQQKQAAKEQERIQRDQERAAAAEERNLKVEGARAETAQTRAERNAFYGAIDQDVKDRVTDAAAVYRATGDRTDLEEWQKALQSMQRHEMNAEMDSYADRLNRMINPTGAAGVDLSTGWAAAQVAMRDNLLKLQSDFASALIDPTQQATAGSILKQIGSETSKLEQSLADTQKLNDAAKALETTGNYSRVSQSLKDDLTAAMDAMNNATPDKFLESMNAVRGAISAISNEMKSIGVQDYWNQQTAALQNYNSALTGLTAQYGDTSGWTNSQQAAYTQAQNAFGRAQAAMNAGDQAAYQLASKEGTDKLNALNQSFKEIGALSANSKPQVDALSRSLMNFAAPMMLVRKFTGYMKKAAQNVSAIDSQMADLKKVTNNTDAEYQMFLQRAGQHAVQIGSSITDLVATTSTFAHMGYDLNQSQALGVTATKFANVGGFKNTTDAADTIIAAIKGFKDLNIGDADEVGDKLTAVANNYAVTATDISEGLRHSASALNVAGNDIDQSTAMITAIAEVTRDAGGAGSALKVLSMRIRGAKAELQDAGESTEGMAESTSKLRAEVYGLTNIGGKGGVDIMADENTFKSTYDILQGISKVWGQMSDINRSALLEKLAGKVRSNQVAALLENFDQAERVLETSQNAQGTMSKVHARWLDSVEARQAQFKAAQETASMAAMPAGVLKDLYQAGTTGLGWLTQLMGFSGSGGVGLGVLGTATALKSGMGNIWAGLGNAFNRHIGGKGQKDLINAYNLAFSDATQDNTIYHNKAGALAAAETTTGQKANAYTKRLVEEANGKVDAAKATSTLAASLKGLAKNALGAVATFGAIELASAAAQWAWQKLDENVFRKGEYLAAAADAAHAEYTSAKKEVSDVAETKKTLQTQIDDLTIKQTSGTITKEEQAQLAMLRSQMREVQLQADLADRKAKAKATQDLEAWVKSEAVNGPSGSARTVLDGIDSLNMLSAYFRTGRFSSMLAEGEITESQFHSLEDMVDDARKQPNKDQYVRDAISGMVQSMSSIQGQYAQTVEAELAKPGGTPLIAGAVGFAKITDILTKPGLLKANELVEGFNLASQIHQELETGDFSGAINGLGENDKRREALAGFYANWDNIQAYMASQAEEYISQSKNYLPALLTAGNSASDESVEALKSTLQAAISITKALKAGDEEDLAIFDLMDSILNVTEFGDALDTMTKLAIEGKDVGEIINTVSDSFPGLANVMGYFGQSVDWAADMAVKNAEKSEQGGGGAPVEEIKSSQSRIDSNLTAQALAAKVWKDSGFTGSIDTTSKDYNELMALDGGAYKAAVKHANGALFFDKDAFNRIVQDRYKEQFNDLKKDAADAELKYAEAAAKFLKQLDKKEKGEGHDTAAYQSAMEDMKLYGGRLSEYRGMMSQIDYGMSGLANWMNEKKTAESGDVYDEMGEAAQALITGKESGKVGTRQFAAALKWFAGEGATPDDLTTEDWNMLARVGAVKSNGKADETVRMKAAQDIRQRLIKLGVMDKNGTIIDPDMTLGKMADIYNAAYKTHARGEFFQSVLMGLNDTIFESDQKYTFGNSSVANQDPAVAAAQDALNKALDAYNSGTGSLEDLAKASKDYLSEMTRATNRDVLGSADAEKDPLGTAMAAINASEQEQAAGGGSGGESNKLTDVLSQISGFLDSLNSYLRGEENKPGDEEKPPEGEQPSTEAESQQGTNAGQAGGGQEESAKTEEPTGDTGAGVITAETVEITTGGEVSVTPEGAPTAPTPYTSEESKAFYDQQMARQKWEADREAEREAALKSDKTGSPTDQRIAEARERAARLRDRAQADEAANAFIDQFADQLDQMPFTGPLNEAYTALVAGMSNPDVTGDEIREMTAELQARLAEQQEYDDAKAVSAAYERRRQERRQNEEKQNRETLHELQTGVDQVYEASDEDNREALLSLLDGLRVGLRTDTQSEFQAKADELSALVNARRQAQADAEAARQEALDGISGFLNSETVQGYLQSGDQQYDDLFTMLYNYMENGGGTAEEINALFSQLQASYNGKKLTDKTRAEQQERDRIAAEAAANAKEQHDRLLAQNIPDAEGVASAQGEQAKHRKAAEEVAVAQFREEQQRLLDEYRETLTGANMPDFVKQFAGAAELPRDAKEAVEAAKALDAAVRSGADPSGPLTNLIAAVANGYTSIRQRHASEAAAEERIAADRRAMLDSIYSEENQAIIDAASDKDRNDIKAYANIAQLDFESGDWVGFINSIRNMNAALKRAQENTEKAEAEARLTSQQNAEAEKRAALLKAQEEEAEERRRDYEQQYGEAYDRAKATSAYDVNGPGRQAIDKAIDKIGEAFENEDWDAFEQAVQELDQLIPAVAAADQERMERAERDKNDAENAAALQAREEQRKQDAITRAREEAAFMDRLNNELAEETERQREADKNQENEQFISDNGLVGTEAEEFRKALQAQTAQEKLAFRQGPLTPPETTSKPKGEEKKEEAPPVQDTIVVAPITDETQVSAAEEQALAMARAAAAAQQNEIDRQEAEAAEILTRELGERPIISGADMQNAGWTDVPEDDYATVYTSTYTGNGKTVLATPITPTGEVLTEEQLDAYIGQLLESDLGDIFSNDTLGLLLAAMNGENQFTIDRMGAYAQQLHSQQEAQYGTGTGQPGVVSPQSEAELEALYEQADELSSILKTYINQYGQDGNDDLWNKQRELENAVRKGDDANIARLFKDARDLLLQRAKDNDEVRELLSESNELLGEGFDEVVDAGAENIANVTTGATEAAKAGEQSVDVGVDYDVPEVEVPPPKDVVVGVVADTKEVQEELNSLSASATVTVNWESGGMPESPNSKSDGEGSKGGNTVSISGGTKAASGTTYARSGPYLVDEVGQELIEHVSRGTYELGTNEGPRFTRLDAGDIVHTAKETKRILRRGQSMEKVGKAKSGKAYQAGSEYRPTAGGIGAQNYPGTTTTRPSQNQMTTKIEGAPIIVTNEEGWLRTTDEILRWLQTVIDWIPTFLAELKKMTNKFVEAADDVVHYSGKNQLVDEAIGNVSKEIQANVMAAMKYREFLMGLAYKGAIPMEALRDIQHGTLDIQKFAVKNGADDTIIKTIQAYQQYWQKLVACQDALKTLNDQMEALSQQKMTNIIKYFDQMGDLLSNQQKTYETLIDLKKQYGQEINVSDYTDSLNTLQDILTNSQNEETAIVAELSDQLGIGEELVKAILDGGREVWEAIGERVKKGVDEGIEDLTNGLDAQNAAITEGMQTGKIPTYWSTVEGQKQITDDESWAASAFGESGTQLVSILDALTADTSAYGPSFSNHTSTIGGMLGIIPEEYITKYGYISMTTKDQKIPNPELLWPVDTSTIELPVKPTLDEDIISIGEMLGLNMADGSEEALANIETVKSLLTTTWDNPLAIGSETWYSYMSTLEELRESIYSTQIEISEMNDEIAKIPLSNLKTGYNYLEDVRKNLEGVNSLLDAQGASKTPGVFSSLISVGMEEIENLQEQNKLIEAQMSALDPLSEKYQELRDDLNDNLDAIADIRENQERWNDALIDLQIDQLRKQNEKYKEQLSLMRALDDLENARQRRILTYHEMGGFVYEADEDALEAAQESATDAVYNSMMSELERQKETSNIYGPLGERLIQGASIVDSLGNILVPVEDKLSGLDFGSYYQSILDGAEQSGLLTNMLNSIDMAKLLESSIGGNVSIDLSGMTLNEVNDVKDLCDAIMQQLPNYLLQAMYQKGA